LPASERFFAGGDTTVRGFALDRLGTARRSIRKASRKAATAWRSSISRRARRTWKNLQFVWFSTPATVFKHAPTSARRSARVERRWLPYRSPIGPLRVDWGWKLSTRLLLTGGRERSNVLHISLGQAF
jgi:outer membrane protein assembly factor BamA